MATDVFSALANPVRRRLLDALLDGPRAAGDLAGRFELSRPAVSEHLQVLRQAGLVREEPRGRQRYYHLDPAPLAQVGAWLHPFEHYWRGRLTALADLLDAEPTPTEKDTPG
ncbi:ArsR/SmtB family transcription factor [Kitasatospora sp. NPDC048365]|uniref:ArsR/SmtB family transcription factor n=1 Tax=Kitasatospora sp. NPDC048365 TaxID=3364050 RepID=UPI00371AB7A2